MVLGAAMLVSMAIPMVKTHVTAGVRGDYVTDEEGTVIISYEGTGGSITIPDGIYTIGAGAFKGSEVTRVDLNEVTTIGNNAFAESTLSSVTGLGGVSAIGGEAFARTQLESFTVPKSLTRLAGDAFDGDEALTGFSGGSSIYPIYGGCVYSDRGKTLLIVPRGLNDSVTVWKKATAIAPGALKDCNKVTDIYIPATVQQIGVTRDQYEGTAQLAVLPAKSTVYGYEGSPAQAYARKNDVKFVSVGVADGAAAEAEIIAQAEEFHEADQQQAVEIADAGTDPDEQILQASANNENVPVTIAEGSYNTPAIAAEERKKTSAPKSQNKPLEVAESSSSIVYPSDISAAAARSPRVESDYNYIDEFEESYGYDEDYDYYDELNETSTGRSGEVAARIVVPDETPINNSQSSSDQNQTQQSNTTNTNTSTDTSEGLPVEGGGTVSDNGQNQTNTQTNNTVSDNGQSQTNTNTTVSDNGQNQTVTTDNTQQNTNTNTNISTTDNTADKVAHALDATPKTADLSIGAPFIFAAGLFMAGFSGLIMTRRRKSPAVSIEYDSKDDDQLD